MTTSPPHETGVQATQMTETLQIDDNFTGSLHRNHPKRIWIAAEKMAKKARTITTDDLDGSPGAKPVRFSLDSQDYEIDLGPFNRQRLREELQLFTSAGRRAGSSKATSNGQ